MSKVIDELYRRIREDPDYQQALHDAAQHNMMERTLLSFSMEEKIWELESELARLRSLLPQWVSVETPPKEMGAYITTCEDRDGTRFVKAVKWHPIYCTCGGGWQTNSKIVSWQPFPLPQPPEEPEHAE